MSRRRLRTEQFETLVQAVPQVGAAVCLQGIEGRKDLTTVKTIQISNHLKEYCKYLVLIRSVHLSEGEYDLGGVRVCHDRDTIVGMHAGDHS